MCGIESMKLTLTKRLQHSASQPLPPSPCPGPNATVTSAIGPLGLEVRGEGEQVGGLQLIQMFELPRQTKGQRPFVISLNWVQFQTPQIVCWSFLLKSATLQAIKVHGGTLLFGPGNIPLCCIPDAAGGRPALWLVEVAMARRVSWWTGGLARRFL